MQGSLITNEAATQIIISSPFGLPHTCSGYIPLQHILRISHLLSTASAQLPPPPEKPSRRLGWGAPEPICLLWSEREPLPRAGTPFSVLIFCEEQASPLRDFLQSAGLLEPIFQLPVFRSPNIRVSRNVSSKYTCMVLTILCVLSGAMTVISKFLRWDPPPVRSESRDPPSSCLSLTLIMFGTLVTNESRRDSFRHSFVRRDALVNPPSTPVSMILGHNYGNTLKQVFPLNRNDLENDSNTSMYILSALIMAHQNSH
jgi:hypothetical protein